MSDAIRAAQGSQDVVAEGVAALRAFGADLCLADAMKLLPLWHYAGRLTAAERVMILENFTDTDTEQACAAAIVALLRLLERCGIDREILADLTASEQAAVFAAEARVAGGAR